MMQNSERFYLFNIEIEFQTNSYKTDLEFKALYIQSHS